MQERFHFWVVGGDRRQIALARLLGEDGHYVHTYLLGGNAAPALPAPNLEGIENAHCVILGLPALTGEYIRAPTADETLPVSELLEVLHPRQLLCGGQLSPDLIARAAARGIFTADYFRREELAIANAVPTSEGAIQIAMEELPITLHDARVLVLGAGRLGKVLCQQLKGLGAHVTLCARKYADLAWARVWGCDTARSDQLGAWLCGYDCVINTVPALLLNREALSALRADCLLIDLASQAGGIDFPAAEELGLRAIHALALPARVAPLTAARAIRSALYNILSEQGA